MVKAPKYIFIILIVILVIFDFGHSKAQTCRWAVKAGGVDNDNISGFDVDKYGNTYIAGTFYDSLSFGSTKLYSTELWSIFLAKYNVNGQLDWAKIVSNDTIVFVSGLNVDISGNISIIGRFAKTAFFGNSNQIQLNSQGNFDAFIAHFSNKGDVNWAKSIGSEGLDNFSSICSDSLCNLLLTGNLYSSSDIYSDSKIFLTKIDSLGNNKWFRNSQVFYEGHISNSIKVDNQGNCFIIGEYYNSIEFDSTAIIMADNVEGNSFVAKFNSDGNFIWGQTLGSDSGFAVCKNVIIDSEGNTYISGSYRGTINVGQFTLKTNSKNEDNIYFVKYDIDGLPLWVKQSVGVGEVKGLSFDPIGNLYAVGIFSKSYKFDNITLNSFGGNDVFILKMNDQGYFLSASSFGGQRSDNVSGFKSNTNGMFIVGNFIDKIDFGNSISLKGLNTFNTDIYLSKFDFPSSIENEQDIKFKNVCFPNPSRNYISLPNGIEIGSNISIYSECGILELSIKASERINIDCLPIGIHFIKDQKESFKFIKE